MLVRNSDTLVELPLPKGHHFPKQHPKGAFINYHQGWLLISGKVSARILLISSPLLAIINERTLREPFWLHFFSQCMYGTCTTFFIPTGFMMDKTNTVADIIYKASPT